MNDQEFRTMNENEFDSLLIQNLSEIPPDDIVNDVTPWKQAMDKIIAGIALSTITFRFFCLDYILPVIGIVAMFLGFRALKKENSWFCLGFIATIVRMVCLFPVLIVNATIFQNRFTTSVLAPVLTGFNILFALITFYSLWRAIRIVQQKANVEPHAESATALIVWYIMVCALGIIKIDGMIIVGGILIVYFFIIRSLIQLSKELDETGYLVQPSEVRFSDSGVIKGITGVLLIGILCGYMFFDSYSMEWKVKEIALDEEAKEIAEIKENLTSLGFPKEILEDMSDEDVLNYKEAEQVVVDVNEYPFNDGREVEESYQGERWITTVYDVKELKVTDIAVELADNKTWIFFHHFLWQEEPKIFGISGFHGTESIQICPVYYNNNDGWSRDGNVSGQLLYDKDNEPYVADYYYLGEKSYTSNDVFFGARTSNDLFAAFSLPNDGEKQRGYIMYQAQEIEEGWATSSWFNYTHQEHFFQYPVMTAMELRMANSWNDAGAFMTVQDAFQFYVTDEGVEMVGE